jgi:CDP-2,3-bis-(O-geranylgeranyl)-sn-glycerol synthase
MAPVILAKFKLVEFLNVPVDFNRKLDGEPLFGRTKTWRGIIGGAICGMLVIALQTLIYKNVSGVAFLYLFVYDFPAVLLLGFLQGLGVGLADLMKSFFKRRLHIPSSARFMPFDQMDFIGGVILGSLIYQLPTAHLAAILIISPVLPMVANWIAFRLKWKKVPW